MACLDEAALDDFVGGRLHGDARGRVESHLDACAQCRDVVVVLAGGDPTGAPGLARGAEIGRHLVLEPIGRGAMGVVYLAYDPTLDRKVALKVIRPERADEERAERMLREAQALARLSHPNVVAVYDAGRSDAGVFVAMEYVEGATLRAWLAREARSWRDVCRVFGQAGAGLRAAHEAGLVHRDFKPDNVLVGADGRVRVTDFGLARSSPEAPPAGADLGSIDATRSHALVGTPAYMAPEQLAGERASAASDQFAFAVALYEALHGARPFAGTTLLGLKSAIEHGAPPQGKIPGRLAAVVRRGLAARPEARYPSMAALLDDLARAVTPARGRALLAAGAIAVLGAAALVRALRPAPMSDPCGGGDARSAAVWSASRRADLERALGASQTPAAAAIASRASAGLDDYARAWRTSYRATCEATNVRHEQSADVLDARMHCLETRLDALGAVAGALTRADPDTAASASDAVSQLPAIADCDDTVSLAAMDPRPRAPDVAARLADVERRLADAQAIGLAGRYDDARAAIAPLVKEATEIAYRPIVAESHLLAATFARRAGAYPDASREADQALFAAEAGRDDRRAARAWLELVAIAGERGATSEVQDLGRRAEAALARVGSPAELVGTLRHQRGVAFTTAGALPEAKVELEAALALREKVRADSTDVARTVSALGNLARARGDLEEALATHRRALAIDERALGEGHPATARHFHNIGGVLRLLGRRDEALASYQRALALEGCGSGARHPATALTHNSIAILYLEAKDPARARGELDIALPILEEAGHPDRGLVLHNLGIAAQLEGNHKEALARFDAALAVLRPAYGEDHERVKAVLASRAVSLRALGPARPAPRPPASAAAPVKPPAMRPPTGAYGPAQTWD
jgi:tetratricopeptide (TPR) repeat protein/tRNA A-37 threonylcarbamoyl transferase component Bud32